MAMVSMDLDAMRLAIGQLDTFTRRARAGWPQVEHAATRAQIGRASCRERV